MATESFCNKYFPMSESEKDNPTKYWIHEDVTELHDLDVLGVAYKCNVCKHEFISK